jgi:hypothetical protein
MQKTQGKMLPDMVVAAMVVAAAVVLLPRAAGAIPVNEVGTALGYHSETAANTGAIRSDIAVIKADTAEIKQRVNDILDSLCPKGSLSDGKATTPGGGLLSMLDASGSSGSFAGTSVLGTVSGQAQLLPDLSILRDAVGLAQGAAEGDLGSVSSAIRLAQKLMRLQGQAGLSPLVTGHAAEVTRLKYSARTAEEALGAAMYNRQTAATGNVRVRKVADQAKAAECLRAQVHVLTGAVLLAVEEMQQMRGLLATKAQMDAATRFRPEFLPSFAVREPEAGRIGLPLPAMEEGNAPPGGAPGGNKTVFD